MIKIERSTVPDHKRGDMSTVTKEELYSASEKHIADVAQGLRFFASLIEQAILRHDRDKLTDIDSFHADFITNFKTHEWWDRHQQINRHHLTMKEGVPADVNLIDVFDFITDCVMAGMARNGMVYPIDLPNDVLRKAFKNTVELLQREVVAEGGAK